MFQMLMHLIVASILAAVIEASPFQNAVISNYDCNKQCFKRGIQECCNVTKQQIWGDLTSSFQTCGRKIHNHVSVSPSLEDSKNSSPKVPGNNESMSEIKSEDPSFMQRGKRLYDKIGQFIKAAYDMYKQWMGILQDSLIILTDRHGRRGNKECVMECVFEQEGFLKDNRLDKVAILERFKSKEGESEEWHKVALAAAQKCLQNNVGPTTNSLCNSGASEMFECVFKEIFFNCPSWPENNEYCDSLKEFYQKCPNSPPPPIDDKLPNYTGEPENTTESA